MLACPTHKTCHKGMGFECSQTDEGRQYGPCPVRGVQRDSQKYGPYPSRTATADIDTTDPKVLKHPSLLEKIMGFHQPDWRWLVGRRYRGCSPDLATLNAQSTHHGPRPGPKLEPCAHAGPCVPRSREQKKRSAAGREKLDDVHEKFVSYRVRYWVYCQYAGAVPIYSWYRSTHIIKPRTY